MEHEYWITWQCADNEDGDYFLTGFLFDRSNLSRDELVKKLMSIALEIEGIKIGIEYEVASILRVDSAAQVHVVY